MTKDIIPGGDISTYQSLINAGAKFYDFEGKEASLIKVLSDAGVNWETLWKSARGTQVAQYLKMAANAVRNAALQAKISL